MTAHDQSDPTSPVRVAFFLNLGFTILEVVGGLWTNSLAILSDALHDLGDSVAIGVSWYLERLSAKGKNRRFSYGYRRLSLLASLITATVLLSGALFVLTEAIPRLIRPQHSNAQGMLLFSIVGIVVNGVAAFRLRGGKTMNARMIAWHLVEDVLGWVAVLVVSLMLLLRDIHILDPILSILITVYVLYNVVRNLRETVVLFLQAAPGSLDIDAIEQRLRAIPEVRSMHHTHIWSLDGQHHVLTTHVVVAEETPRDRILRVKKAFRDIAEGIGLEHTTLEVEYEDEDCLMKDT
ncbi:MAG TPA: cation diffusion facilitator family transporter [Anaerolineales bacterium]|nr:cation diffusion facilitator family transporter [Anaerolineales bacterium]